MTWARSNTAGVTRALTRADRDLSAVDTAYDDVLAVGSAGQHVIEVLPELDSVNRLRHDPSLRVAFYADQRRRVRPDNAVLLAQARRAALQSDHVLPAERIGGTCVAEREVRATIPCEVIALSGAARRGSSDVHMPRKQYLVADADEAASAVLRIVDGHVVVPTDDVQPPRQWSCSICSRPETPASSTSLASSSHACGRPTVTGEPLRIDHIPLDERDRCDHTLTIDNGNQTRAPAASATLARPAYADRFLGARTGKGLA